MMIRRHYLLLAFLLLSTPSYAQDIQILGIDPLKSASYQCLRHGDPKLSQINVVSKNGKSKNVSSKAAKRALKRSRKVAKKRLKAAKKRQNQISKKIARLASKLLLTEKQRSQLETLKAQSTIVDARVTDLVGYSGALSELISSLADCFKPLKVSGNVEIFSGTYVRNNGDVYFYALLHIRWEDYQANNGNVCAQVAGNSETVKNASGSYQLEAPAVSSFNPTFNLCLYKVDNNIQNGCYVRYDGYMSPLVGMGGQQKPGTCGQDEERCSLAAALKILNSRLSQITVGNIKACS